jgi:hypothetical protein
MSAVTILRIMASRARAVEPLAHFLAGLEERHGLLLHRHVLTGTGSAAGPGRPVLDGERAEATQFDAIPARNSRDDLTEDSVDDILDVALLKMRVLRRDARHEFGFDHRCCRPWLGGTNRSARWSTTPKSRGLFGQHRATN